MPGKALEVINVYLLENHHRAYFPALGRHINNGGN